MKLWNLSVVVVQYVFLCDMFYDLACVNPRVVYDSVLLGENPNFYANVEQLKHYISYLLIICYTFQHSLLGIHNGTWNFSI